MNDPNATYKSAYQSLREELGREPTCRDKGWLEIGEAYRRAWGPAAETLVAPERPDRATAIDSRPETSAVAVSDPKPPEEYSRPAQPAVEGDRGPSGGIMANCVQCGRLWERPKRVGRPAYKCGECR